MKSNQEKNRKAQKRFFTESVGIFLIIAAPFLFKLHDFMPQDPNATIDFLWFSIDRHGFDDIRTFTWFLLTKIIPFYLLLIWFFTNKHWWYHILLIPICMYAFQIFEVLYDDELYVDTENVLWLLPVCMVVIPFVYFIRIKLYDKFVHGIDLDAMDAELQYYKDKERREMDKISSKHLKPDLESKQEEETSAPKDSNSIPNKALKRSLASLQHSLKSLFNMLF